MRVIVKPIQIFYHDKRFNKKKLQLGFNQVFIIIPPASEPVKTTADPIKITAASFPAYWLRSYVLIKSVSIKGEKAARTSVY